MNISARQARHEKLDNGINPDPGATPPKRPKPKFGQRLILPLLRLYNLNDDQPLLKRLSVRLAGLIFLFFVGTAFVPLNHYSGWEPVRDDYEDECGLIIVGEDEDGACELTAWGEDPLADLIDFETGIMSKSNVKSEPGQRDELGEFFTYTVQSGDSLSGIAEQFGLKNQTLVMENELWYQIRLRTGSTLRIPPVDGVTHLVKEEDSISSIAEHYKIDEELILTQNKFDEDEVLVAEVRIIIPGGEKKKPKNPEPTKPSNPEDPPDISGPKNPGRLIWPTNGCGKLSQEFHSGHAALDIACSNKGPIFASADGTVIKAHTGCGSRQTRCGGGYGNYIIIDHGGGMHTLYGHNETLYVSVGDTVQQGKTIAWMGNTGRVTGKTGIHVHWEVRINGGKRNPFNFL